MKKDRIEIRRNRRRPPVEEIDPGNRKRGDRRLRIP
jgi:hypothetical protein